jgi:hypothetical protein
MFDRLKTHYEEQKPLYSHVAVGVLFAGITCFIMRGRIVALALRGVNGPETADTLVTNHPLFSFLSGQDVVIIRNEIGRPSYLVHDIDTDLWYRSQTAAARALGVSVSRMSNHLNGQLEHVDGHYLERVPFTYA